MDLITAARNGQQTAFLQLYGEHHRPIFQFAYRLTGSVADAEDIVQECFLGLLRPKCGFDPSRTPLRTYLFGAARNQALKRLRKRDETGDEPSTPAGWPSPETEAAQSEFATVLARAIAQLPETQREVLNNCPSQKSPRSSKSRPPRSSRACSGRGRR
jgi:RNA polymerase sigma-70 factor (ECF subfamily)